MIRMMAVLLGCMLFFSGCGGGGGSTAGTGDTTSSAVTTLSGTVAAGAPVVGVVNVKGANGGTAQGQIEADGSYSINVSSLTPAFILYAEGTVNGRSIEMYSSGTATGTINITPVTDFIVREAASAAATAIFSNWTASQITDQQLDAAKAKVRSQLAAVLSAASISANFDLINDTFSANGTGIDACLDILDISVQADGTTVDVVNKVTQSSFTDSVTTAADDSGAVLPASDSTATGSGMTNLDAINTQLDILETLYATTRPTLAQLTTQFGPFMAADYLEDGQNKTENLTSWVNSGHGPDVGIKLWASIENEIPLSDLPGTYSKGYDVRLQYLSQNQSGSFVSKMVTDGTAWYWWGNQRLLDVNLQPSATMTVSNNNSTSFQTGLDAWISDDSSTAYNAGIRSVIIAGPGLPAAGLIYGENFPSPRFSRISTFYPGDMTDTEINAIPDNATYTFRLYSQTAGSVSLLDTPVDVYTETNPKKPELKSTQTASLFPALVNFTSHNIADANIPGTLNISWMNPPQTTNSWADLNWSDGRDWFQLDNHNSSLINSASFTSTGSPAVDGNLWIGVDDVYGREYHLSWQMN